MAFICQKKLTKLNKKKHTKMRKLKKKHSEWTFGGIPTWVLQDTSLQVRWNNSAWKNYMQGFVVEIATKIEPYLAKHGG